MKQSPTSEPDGRSAGQEISCFLWNLKFHYCVHKSFQWDCILSHMNLVHNFMFYFF